MGFENLTRDEIQRDAHTMATIYTREMLQQMKGQAVKDVWHAMIGKPAGIKNTTGLKNSEEIIKAILEGQQNPEFLDSYKVRGPKQSVIVETKEMPPKPGEKKKRGPKPKDVTLTPTVSRVVPLQAYESTQIPLRVSEVKRIPVKKLYVNEAEYFLHASTNQLYTVVEGRPGTLCGTWNPQTKTVQEL